MYSLTCTKSCNKWREWHLRISFKKIVNNTAIIQIIPVTLTVTRISLKLELAHANISHTDKTSANQGL